LPANWIAQHTAVHVGEDKLVAAHADHQRRHLVG
jgi:hypothetical protein